MNCLFVCLFVVLYVSSIYVGTTLSTPGIGQRPSFWMTSRQDRTPKSPSNSSIAWQVNFCSRHPSDDPWRTLLSNPNPTDGPASAMKVRKRRWLVFVCICICSWADSSEGGLLFVGVCVWKHDWSKSWDKGILLTAPSSFFLSFFLFYSLYISHTQIQIQIHSVCLLLLTRGQLGLRSMPEGRWMCEHYRYTPRTQPSR